jgi:hypothetical protein
MKSVCCLALIAVAFAGCIENEYSIELVPTGKMLDRKVTVRRHGGNADFVSERDVQRLAKEYQVARPEPAKEHVFRGTFSGQMPSDVGGQGTFTRWETSLGSVDVYVERFRGDDDAAGQWQRRQRAADRLVELLVAWLEQEMKDDLKRPALLQFFDDDFRRDLYNVSFYIWMHGLTEPADNVGSPLMRGLQYLMERDYFTPDEVPAIRRAIDDIQRDDYQRLVALARRMIVARLPGNTQPALKNFATPERLTESVRSFLTNTREFRAQLEEWHEQLKTDFNAAKPDPLDVVSELLSQLFLEGVYQPGGDRLTVRLKTDRSPILTNGRWSVDSASIEWGPTIVPGESLPPAFVYAVWDAPDEPAQKKHFGKVAIQGQALLDFCTWYRGLTEREQGEWDALIARLHPGPELINDLETFRFSDEPVGGDKNKRLAKSMIDTIIGELNRGS